MSVEIQKDGREEQRERNGDGDNQCTAHIAEEQENNQGDQENAVRQIAQDGMRRVVHKVAAVQVGDELDPGRKDAIVQLRDLGVQRIQRGVRLGALA
jgi:lipopolysaccharide biosynthesis regulator YciM